MSSTDKSDDGTIALVAECLCKANKFTAHVPRAELPLRAVYCHCNSCRHVTGAMHTSDIPWPGDDVASLQAAVSSPSSSLRRYAFSQRLGLLFCSTCGTSMFWESHDEGAVAPRYGVLTGVLANVNVENKSLIKVTDHIFVGDTLDGGATPWLCDTNDDGIEKPKIWRGKLEGSEIWEQQSHAAAAAAANSDATAISDKYEVPVRCKCGGVDLVFRSPAADYAAKARAELPWFVDPVCNKGLGGFDACDSCRVTSGADVFNWTFCLMQHLGFPSSGNDDETTAAAFPQSTKDLQKAIVAAEPERDPRLGALAIYESSPGVQRYFCGRCSATVFYAADHRPEMVDLAIGLLWSKTGARAEELVSWDLGCKMSWRDDVAGGWRERFIERIEEAADRWRIQRGLPKSWRRIQKEEPAKE